MQQQLDFPDAYTAPATPDHDSTSAYPPEARCSVTWSRGLICATSGAEGSGRSFSGTVARAWTGTFSVGVTWMPQLHTGFMAQARISRLLTGSVASLSRPDLYVFLGGSVISIHGQGARVFQNQVLNLEDVLTNIPELLVEPHATFAAFPIGLELRVGNRIGASVFLESAPALNDAPSVGTYLNLLDLLKFHTLGAEVTFCF